MIFVQGKEWEYNKLMRFCKAEGCEKKHFCKGYCIKHHRRFEKYGDPFYTKIESHGMESTPEYRVWRCIKTRCYNKNRKNYVRYGGRGIVVCDRWRNSFITFFKDMGFKPFPKAEIDRINNDGNYEPGNCRWATHAENNQNRTNNKLSMQKAEEIRKIYKAGGVFQRELGLSYGVSTVAIGKLINCEIW